MRKRLLIIGPLALLAATIGYAFGHLLDRGAAQATLHPVETRIDGFVPGGKAVRHHVKLRIPAAGEFKVTGVKTTCGCTRVSLGGIDLGTLERPIPVASGVHDVEVTIDTSGTMGFKSYAFGVVLVNGGDATPAIASAVTFLHVAAPLAASPSEVILGEQGVSFLEIEAHSAFNAEVLAISSSHPELFEVVRVPDNDLQSLNLPSREGEAEWYRVSRKALPSGKDVHFGQIEILSNVKEANALRIPVQMVQASSAFEIAPQVLKLPLSAEFHGRPIQRKGILKLHEPFEEEIVVEVVPQDAPIVVEILEARYQHVREFTVELNRGEAGIYEVRFTVASATRQLQVIVGEPSLDESKK